MITGILPAVLFIIVCLRAVEKRLTKKRGFLSKIHRPASAALIVVSILHIILTFPVLNMRPILIPLTGTLCLLAIFAACSFAAIRKMKLHRYSAVCSALFFVLHIVFNITAIHDYHNQVRAIEFSQIDIANIPDGIYTGECDVSFISATVAVTVQSGMMTDIRLLEHKHDRGQSAEAIIDKLLERQTIEVDAVAGATNSSTVIKKAVENALKP